MLGEARVPAGRHSWLALDMPIYQGRVKGKRLGFFRKPVEEVRIRFQNDLEVTSHETAHLLDHRIPEIRKQWFPATKANKGSQCSFLFLIIFGTSQSIGRALSRRR